MSEVFIVNQTWSYLFAGMSRDESGDHSAFTRPGPALADLTHPRFKWIIEGDPAGPVRIRNAAFGYLFGSAIEKNGDWTAWCRERPSDADLASERFQWRIVRDGDATHLQNLKFNFLFAADRDLDEDDHFVELTRAAPKGGKFSWSLHAWGLEDWMGHVDGGRSLAALTIPGTHDSGANRTSDKGREWSDDVKTAIGEVKTGFGLADTLINAGGSAIRSIGAFGAELVGGTVDSVTAAASMCQVMPIAAQLRAGVRFLDIRVRNHGDSLLIFHGAVYQHQSLGDVLTACYDFLAQHPRECLLMSVKRDHDDASPSLPLGQRFDTYVDGAAGRWYTGGSIPRLDDVRGKIVFLRRFGDPGAHRGIDATDWRDDATFESSTGGNRLRVQDRYKIEMPARDQKWACVKETLEQAAADGDAGTLYLNFSSAVGGLAVPVPLAMARSINPRLREFLAGRPAGRFGVVAMDFPDIGLTEALIRANFG